MLDQNKADEFIIAPAHYHSNEFMEPNTQIDKELNNLLVNESDILQELNLELGDLKVLVKALDAGVSSNVFTSSEFQRIWKLVKMFNLIINKYIKE